MQKLNKKDSKKKLREHMLLREIDSHKEELTEVLTEATKEKKKTTQNTNLRSLKKLSTVEK